jgi:PAS domain S-box-containing protein
MEKGLAFLGDGKYDALLLDLSLPDAHGIETLIIAQKKNPNIPILIMTGLDDKEIALEAVRKGAQDYIVKGQVDGQLLVRSINYAIERKKTQEALRNSEEKLRRILESSPDAITVSDVCARIIDCNQSTLAMLGYSEKEEVIGRQLYDLISRKDQERAMEDMKKTMIQGWIRNAEYGFITRDGREFPAEVSASLVRDITGAPASVVAVSKDITERKRSEALMRQYVEDLERSNTELKHDMERLIDRVGKRIEDAGISDVTSLAEEEKGIFLYTVDDEERAYSRFASMMDRGLPVLAITRRAPARLHRLLERDLETIWLTTNRVPEQVCVDPSNITKLSIILKEFYEHASGGVVLFEGIEYLLSNIGFRDFLNLIQFLNDRISLGEGSIYLVVDMEVLDERDARYLQRECLLPGKGPETISQRVHG